MYCGAKQYIPLIGFGIVRFELFDLAGKCVVYVQRHCFGNLAVFSQETKFFLCRTVNVSPCLSGSAQRLTQAKGTTCTMNELNNSNSDLTATP